MFYAYNMFYMSVGVETGAWTERRCAALHDQHVHICVLTCLCDLLFLCQQCANQSVNKQMSSLVQYLFNFSTVCHFVF